MTDPMVSGILAVEGTFSLVGDALAKPPALDPFTLAAAEKVVRDRIAKTKWAQDAATLRLAADAIHKLGATDE